jgi:GNAT superfamily N-acetyltransferase
VDQWSHLAVVAEWIKDDGAEIVGVAELVRLADTGGEGELGIVVADGWRRRGIGTALVRSLAIAAWRVGILEWRVVRLRENEDVHRLVERVASHSGSVEAGGVVESSYRLLTAGVPSSSR